jgi:anti-sigma regulatory factor (Ser/Thr protein kinase)
VNATPAARTVPAPAPVLPGVPGTREYLHGDAFTLPAHGSGVPQARHHLCTLLTRWAVDPGLRDDAALIISELFTNALIHTDSSQIMCRILAAPHTLYLSITDQGHGPTGPRIRPTHTGPERDSAESGRGLLLVSALATTWGVATDPAQGRTVWAVLNLEGVGCRED